MINIFLDAGFTIIGHQLIEELVGRRNIRYK